MPRRGVLLCCIKSKWLTLLTMSQRMMYVWCCTENTTTLSTRCRRGLGGRTIVWNAKRHFITSISTSANQNTLVTYVRKRLACTSHPAQDYVNNVLVYFANSTCFKNHEQNEVCARATSCEKWGHWFAGPICNPICESCYFTYCNKEVIRNHE